MRYYHHDYTSPAVQRERERLEDLQECSEWDPAHSGIRVPQPSPVVRYRNTWVRDWLVLSVMVLASLMWVALMGR